MRLSSNKIGTNSAYFAVNQIKSNQIESPTLLFVSDYVNYCAVLYTYV